MKKAFVATLLALTLPAGAASARVAPSLHALRLSPPVFRGSGFAPYEHVTVSLHGSPVPSVHVVADARGRFRARLAAAPACTAWTVHAVGAGGGTAVYHHLRCASLVTDVEGVVVKSIKNVCTEQSPCTSPVSGVTVEAFEGGGMVASTTTDDKGAFTFSLANGDYTIEALGHGARPKTVHVSTASSAHIAFLINAGLV